MSRAAGLGGRDGRGGFTLIEVVGAFVIFAVGVLMVIQLSFATSVQMRYAGVSSALALRAAERLDSLEAEPFSSLSPGTVDDTVVVSGLTYDRSVVLTRMTPVLMRVEVTFEPDGGEGPSYQATSYISEVW